MNAIDSRVISPSCEYCKDLDTQKKKEFLLSMFAHGPDQEEKALKHVDCVVNIDLNDRDYYDTSLRSAISFRLTRLVKKLIGLGADIKATNKYGDSLFSEVVRQCHLPIDRDWAKGEEIFNLLWESNLRNINVRGFLTQTPLETAVIHHNKKAVLILGEKGADQTIANPMRSAAMQRDLEMVKLLYSLPKGVEVFKKLRTGAVDSGDEKLSSFLAGVPFVKAANE